MSHLLTELTTKAEGLDPGERAQLAHWLLESLGPADTLSNEDWEKAWSDEVARRIAGLDAGDTTLPAAEVLAEARRRFG